MIPVKENPLSDGILADGRSEQGSTGVCALPLRIARYSKARHLSLRNAEYCQTHGHVKEYKKLANCANYLVFRHYFTVDQLKLHAASFCKKHLICPMCAVRRGSKMLSAYLEKYQAVIAENPGLKPYLVTMTIKNGERLQERFMHLRKAMRGMFEARRNSLKGQRFVEFARSEGGFHSIEVTNKGKGWHPHVHMIWLCRTKPNQETLSQEWQAITGDSFIVDVRPLHDPVEGFLEVCKYALKFSELSPALNFEAYQLLSGHRLIDSHGLMRGVEIPEELTDEPLDGLPYIELFYKYVQHVGYSYHHQATISETNKYQSLKRSRAEILADIFNLPIS